MPYCPSCKQQFAEGIKECPTHHAALVDELPFQTVDAPGVTWVEIASAATEDEARLLQGFLEAEGIPCQVESLRFGMEPVNFGKMGEIRIYVSAENAEEAMRLLRERDQEYQGLKDEESIVTDEGPAEIDDDAPVDNEQA
jgi:putative signal transducing protein